MPRNPHNRVFIQRNKKPHATLGLIIASPGRWGKMSLAREMGWDIYDFKKIIRKLVSKGLIESKANKLYPTDVGHIVYKDAFLHRDR